MGLSPFEVLRADLEDVIDLYVKCIIHDSKDEKNKNNKNNGDVWLTSKTANWH